MPSVDENVFSFQGYTLDLYRGCLRTADHEIELRPKSFAVLRYLVENAGRLVSKDELIGTVWNNVTVTEVSLARCVSDVRLALQDREQVIIKTVPRRGYLFDAPISRAPNASVRPERAPIEAQFERHQGDRRQLTIVACDIIGLPALSTQVDIEDLPAVTRACRERCTEIIEQHRGYLAAYTGDGLIAYFGFPKACEQDAENAIRSALALREFAAQFGTELKTQLTPSIGIATGTVLIGDGWAADAVKGRIDVGEALTLSQRLQALAEPGQIIIAQSTRRLGGGLFEYFDLGRVCLKGMKAPLEVANVLGESGVESRFEADHSTDNLPPLVGRQDEIGLLFRRWSQAKAGDGSVVLLAGEPGIGKSRIAQAFQQLLGSEEHACLRLSSSLHRENSALYLFIGHLVRAAGLRRADTDEQRLTKLETALAQAASDLGNDVPLLAELLSIPIGDRYPPLTLTPQQRREKTLKALLAYVEGLATVRPLLLVIEDLHWADPTSLELIDLIVERAPRLRILLIMTFRPEFVPPWIDRSQTTLLTLGRLPLSECREIIAGVIQGKRLPKVIAQQILDHTDGVPLFIEELTKAIVESGVLADEGDRYSVIGSLPELEVPMTLQASLLARLDRLGLARQVAQVCAALGRQFPHQLISAVAELSQEGVRDALAKLVSAGLIRRRGNPPDAEYTFKHALVQDAAYGTLLREPRRTLHARIAEILESQFADSAESQPEFIAHHYTEAGRIEKAATLWGKAGQLSLARSGMREAAVQLARALKQIESLPGTPTLRREQIMLQIALANALMHTKGYAAPETKASLDQVRSLVERAEALGEPPEDPMLLFSVLHGVWVAGHVAFDGDAVHQLAGEFLALAEKQRMTFPHVLGHRIMGTSLLYLGDVEGGRRHLDQAMSLYDPVAHRPLASRLGQDGGVAILSNRVLALWLLGYPRAALKDADDALESARELKQAGTYLYALTRIASFHLVCGNYDTAAAQSQELTAIADDIDGSYWKAAGAMTQGCLFALAGKASIAIPMITAGMTASRLTGAKLRLPWYLSCLGQAHAELGQLDEAQHCIDKAMAAKDATREAWQDSDLHRIAGDLALMSPEPNTAKAQMHYERALAVARAQNAKSWELRAAVALARLWRDRGRRQQALNLLAPIYGWFTEGFDTPDLKKADALLVELTSRN